MNVGQILVHYPNNTRITIKKLPKLSELYNMPKGTILYVANVKDQDFGGYTIDEFIDKFYKDLPKSYYIDNYWS